MASNKIIRLGPVALTTTLTTNIINPAAAGSGTGYTVTADYLILRHVRIVNKTASAATFSLYIGATGGNVAGTEFMGIGLSDAADLLVGGAGTATALTFEAEGEVGKV